MVFVASEFNLAYSFPLYFWKLLISILIPLYASYNLIDFIKNFKKITPIYTEIKKKETIWGHCLRNLKPYRLKEFFFDIKDLLTWTTDVLKSIKKTLALLLAINIYAIIFPIILIFFILNLNLLLSVLLINLIRKKDIELTLNMDNGLLYPKDLALLILKDGPEMYAFAFTYFLIIKLKAKNIKEQKYFLNIIEKILFSQILGKSTFGVNAIFLIFNVILRILNDDAWNRKKYNYRNISAIIMQNINKTFYSKISNFITVFWSAKIKIINGKLDINMKSALKETFAMNREWVLSNRSKQLLIHPAKIIVGQKFHTGYVILEPDDQEKGITAVTTKTFKNSFPVQNIRIESDSFEEKRPFLYPEFKQYKISKEELPYASKQYVTSTYISSEHVKLDNFTSIEILMAKTAEIQEVFLNALLEIRIAIKFTNDTSVTSVYEYKTERANELLKKIAGSHQKIKIMKNSAILETEKEQCKNWEIELEEYLAEERLLGKIGILQNPNPGLSKFITTEEIAKKMTSSLKIFDERKTSLFEYLLPIYLQMDTQEALKTINTVIKIISILPSTHFIDCIHENDKRFDDSTTEIIDKYLP